MWGGGRDFKAVLQGHSSVKCYLVTALYVGFHHAAAGGEPGAVWCWWNVMRNGE